MFLSIILIMLLIDGVISYWTLDVKKLNTHFYTNLAIAIFSLLVVVKGFGLLMEGICLSSALIIGHALATLLKTGEDW